MSTTIELLDPRGLNFEQWSRWMAERSNDLGIVAGGTEKDWKSWARSFVGTTSVSAVGAPAPEAFQNWRDWATAMFNYQTITV